jgi:hypothetical protein
MGWALPTGTLSRRDGRLTDRMLKNPVILAEGGNAGDWVISEARRIWSHLLILGPRKNVPE